MMNEWWLNEWINFLNFLFLKVGYDHLGLAIDYEFPDKPAVTDQKNKKNENKYKVFIPEPVVLKLNSKLEKRLQSAGRQVKIYSRINIKIKPADINSHLHHLVRI